VEGGCDIISETITAVPEQGAAMLFAPLREPKVSLTRDTILFKTICPALCKIVLSTACSLRTPYRHTYSNECKLCIQLQENTTLKKFDFANLINSTRLVKQEWIFPENRYPNLILAYFPYFEKIK
jgi:hypothetical protein